MSILVAHPRLKRILYRTVNSPLEMRQVVSMPPIARVNNWCLELRMTRMWRIGAAPTYIGVRCVVLEDEANEFRAR